MFWQKIGNSVSDRLFRDSVIAENQCLYFTPSFNRLKSTDSNTAEAAVTSWIIPAFSIRSNFALPCFVKEMERVVLSLHNMV